MGDLGMSVGQLEGSLPPCLRIAVFDGRRAWWHEEKVCGHFSPNYPARHYMSVGPISKWEPMSEGEIAVPWTEILKREWSASSDDDKEAERLWLEAQEVLLGGAE